MSKKFTDYNEFKEALTEGLEGKKAKFVSDMMDKTHDINVSRSGLQEQKQILGDTGLTESTATGSTVTNAITRYDRIFMPLIRRVMPALFATELCGMQPLDGPNGNVRTLRKRYSKTVDNTDNSTAVTAGDEANAQNVYDKYSLLAASQDYDAYDYDTMDPFAQTISLEGERGNPMDLEVLMKSVQTANRKLSASFSLEAEDDLDALDGLSVESEMLSTLTDELRREMDAEVLERLIGLAGTVRALDFANVDGRYAGEKLAAMTISVGDVSAEISRKTKIGGPTWMVASPRILVALENASNSGYVPADRNGYRPSESAMVGTYNGLPVYVDNSADSDYYLLGAKFSEQQTGLIYSPYISLQSSGTIVNSDTFDKRMGVRSRYALVDFTDEADSLGNSPDYIGRASLANLTLGFTNV